MLAYDRLEAERRARLLKEIRDGFQNDIGALAQIMVLLDR